MKSPIGIIFILILVASLSFFNKAMAQRDFSQSEKAQIDQKIDDLMQRYLELSSFISEYSTNSLDEESLRKFPELFANTEVEIHNDLDPYDQTPKQITVKEYIRHLREWYPYGLYVEMTPLNKKSEFTFRNQSVFSTVQSTKTVQGNYKGEEIFTFERDLYFTIVFDPLLTSFKIYNISTTTGNDSCINYKKEAADKFTSNDCPNARKSYLKAQQFCPSDPAVSRGIVSCDSCIDANRKPLFLVARLLPGLGSAHVTTSEQSPAFSSSSAFSLGAGLGAELVALQNRSIRLSGGLGIDYFMHSNEATLTNPYNNGSYSIGMRDLDNDEYVVRYKILSMTESDKFSFLEIPLYAKFEYFFSRSVGLSLKAGGKFCLAMSKTFDVTNGVFYYEGVYEKYGGVVLYDLEEYGFGLFNTTVSGQENKSASGNMVMIFGGLGLTLKVTPALEIYLGGEYSQGLTSMKNPVNNEQITKKRDEIYSMFEATDVNLSAITGEIGIKFALFRY
jgi:hypothetical protein